MEKLFKRYDIRGLIDQFTEEFLYSFGWYYTKWVQDRLDEKSVKIVVGRDMRESSNWFFDYISQGIVDAGGEVVNLGVCTTPMSYFALVHYDADALAMITASHNPKEYNGIKCSIRGPESVDFATGLNEVLAMMKEHGLKGATHHDHPHSPKVDEYVHAYSKFLLKQLSTQQSLKIVADAGNGVGGLDIQAIEEHLPTIEIIPMYFELDGTFPNHQADPSHHETLKDLQKQVLVEGANFGIAYDGDADRLGIVDENGKVVTTDEMIALVAKERLKKEQGVVVCPITVSKVVEETVKEHGGELVCTPVGRSIVAQEFKKHDGVFAAEQSGHFFFKEFDYFDCATLMFIEFVNILAETHKSISELVAELPSYVARPINNIRVSDTQKAIEMLKAEFGSILVSEMDGLKCDDGQVWWSLRASNTEPVVRFNIEGRSEEVVAEMNEKVLAVLSQV